MQRQCFSAEASSSGAGPGTGVHRLAGSFSSRLHWLLRQGSVDGASTAEMTQARNSFINAVGLNSPEAKDGLSPEVIGKTCTKHKNWCILIIFILCIICSLGSRVQFVWALSKNLWEWRAENSVSFPAGQWLWRATRCYTNWSKTPLRALQPGEREKMKKDIKLSHKILSWQQRTEVVTLLHSEANLRSSLTPFYLELFNTIARLEGGIKFLVDLRADLLASQQN